MRRHPTFVVAPVLALTLAAGCGGGADPEPKAAAAPPIATTAPSDGDPATTDRKVDVRGHEMFIACLGTGSPTIVYLHGMGGTAVGGTDIAKRLGDKNRVCTYDRPNGLGASDMRDGPLTGKDAVEDLHALFAAAGERGPYVLLGASHGGLIAGMYAGTYPDDVVGMVLLDSPLPDIFEYERPYLTKDFLPKPGDWEENPEKVDDATTFRQAQALQEQAAEDPRHVPLPEGDGSPEVASAREDHRGRPPPPTRLPDPVLAGTPRARRQPALDGAGDSRTHRARGQAGGRGLGRRLGGTPDGVHRAA